MKTRRRNNNGDGKITTGRGMQDKWRRGEPAAMHQHCKHNDSLEDGAGREGARHVSKLLVSERLSKDAGTVG
jgi:hypothetical protein